MADDVDKVWQSLVTLVMDSRGDWRRRISEATGLPFTQMRALKRLANGPLTLGELASALDADAPAATVAVNGLEKRGLVERKAHADDRRVKSVSLTPEGRRVLGGARRLVERAPDALRSLSADEVEDLRRVLLRLASPERSPGRGARRPPSRSSK